MFDKLQLFVLSFKESLEIQLQIWEQSYSSCLLKSLSLEADFAKPRTSTLF